MYLAVIDLKPLPNYNLSLTFENGENRIFDLNPYLNIGIFKELTNQQIFNTVKVSFDTIEWANEADLDPETLYKFSTKITV
ncbi:MAG: DUF2442 domain-containing protein [Bacteroidota bacterium]